MKYYALIYYVVADYIEKRAQYRKEHLGIAKAYSDNGILVFGGAFADPVDRALLVFCAHDKSVVEEFVDSDPYVINGLVYRWEICEWTVVVGSKYDDKMPSID